MITEQDLRKKIKDEKYYNDLREIIYGNEKRTQELINYVIPGIIHHTIEGYKQFEGNDKTIDSAREFLENIRQSTADHIRKSTDHYSEYHYYLEDIVIYRNTMNIISNFQSNLTRVPCLLLLCNLLNIHISNHKEDKKLNQNKVDLMNSILKSLNSKPVKLDYNGETNFDACVFADVNIKTIEELKKKVAEERGNRKKKEEVAESVIPIEKEEEIEKSVIRIKKEGEVAEERGNRKKKEKVEESVTPIKKEGEKTSLLQKIIKLIVRAISYIPRKLLQGTSALYKMLKSAITRKENPLNLGKDSVETEKGEARPR